MKIHMREEILKQAAQFEVVTMQQDVKWQNHTRMGDQELELKA